MIKKCISKEWKFTEFDGTYSDIDLPHDYAIGKKRSDEVPGGACNGFYPDGKGKYIKYINFEDKKHYILDIDGAYMCTQIFFNENHLAHHPYGYTPFLIDLTSYIISDTSNKLAIITNPLPNTTRWYSGNGIYRDVFLWEGGDIRIEPWNMFVSTMSADEEKAKIKLKFTISSDRASCVNIRFVITSHDTSLIKTEEISINTPVGKIQKEHIIEIPNPHLWDTDNPNLYTLKTEICENDTIVDTSVNEFGIRTISADAVNGLLLNGKPLKLRGGCIHHDHGVLGAAAFPAAEERKIRLLKNSGFNAVRTAHNPPSLALLEICDKLGMIVMDEAFDVWNKSKCDNDYHLFFDDWCIRDISYMVLRDRNHPCVFSYSIGNEIAEVDGTSGADKISEILAKEIRKYDDTRFVTSGIYKRLSVHRAESIDPEDYGAYVNSKYGNDSVKEINNRIAGYEKPLDIVGCNYYYSDYLTEHECYPERVIWGSETHAITFYDSWKLVLENNFIIGDFTWTAFDNMGEVGTGRSAWARDGFLKGISLAKYPWRNCYQGDLDLCGYRRPQSYFREAVWLGNTKPRIFVTHPEHFGESFSGTKWHWYDVDECWTFDDKYIGRPVKVETYTDADKIVWSVNGKEIGESIPQKAIATIETVYEKGEITAVAYKQNVECSRYTLCTTGEASAIAVVPERYEFLADNRDLCYFEISVTDSCGRLVQDSESELKCIVQGGELLGIYSGNPCNEDEYTSNSCHAFKGRALAIVRAKQAGVVSLTVYSDALASGNAQVTAKL